MSKLHHTIYLVVIGSLVAVVIGLLVLRETNDSDQPPAHRIVVFPLQYSSPEVEPFATRLWIEIIHSLNSLPNVELISAAGLPAGLQRPDNHHIWPDKASISFFVEGSVRSDDGQIRTTTQIIDVQSNAHVWSSSTVSSDFESTRIVSDVHDKVVSLTSP